MGGCEFGPRSNPLVAPIDSNKIVILGGAYRGCLSTGFQFNTKTNDIKKVAEETEHVENDFEVYW